MENLTAKQNERLNELHEEMVQGIVVFAYKKKDGKVRQAVGTVCPQILDCYLWPRDITRSSSPKVFTYFDLMRNSFRCFNPENFLGIGHVTHWQKEG